MKDILITVAVFLLVVLAAIVVFNTRGTDTMDWEAIKMDFDVKEDSFSYEVADSEFNGIYQNIAKNTPTYCMVGKNLDGTYRIYFVKKVGIKSVVLRVDSLVVDSNGSASFQNNEGANLVSTFTNGGRQVVIKGAAYSVGDSSIAGTYNRVKNIRRFAMSEFNI